MAPPASSKNRQPGPLGCAIMLFLSACSSGMAPNASLSRTPEHRPERKVYVYDCQDGFTFTAEVGRDAVWLFLPDSSKEIPHVPSASGAKYDDGTLTFWSKGDEALLDVDGHHHSGCRVDPRASIWEAAKLRGVDFRAVGNEPGWHLEITRGGETLLVTDYGQRRYRFPSPEPIIDQAAPRTTYNFETRGAKGTIILEPGPCADSMADDEVYETRVTIHLDGHTLSGCGQALH